MKKVKNIYRVPLNDVEIVDYCEATNSFLFYMVDGEILKLSPVLKTS